MSTDLAVFIAALLFAVVSLTYKQQKVAALRVAWRQKLTIVVSKPTGEVSGSAVTEVTYFPVRKPGGIRKKIGLKSRVVGEAVVVEVLPGRFLFASLCDAEAYPRGACFWVWSAFGMSETTSVKRAMERLKSAPLNQPTALPAEAWPVMITFDDISRQETARIIADNRRAAYTFGEGVRLKTVTLEITQAAITQNRIEKVLKWMPKAREGSDLPQIEFLESTFQHKLTEKDFIRL